jgi:hypothetical protein
MYEYEPPFAIWTPVSYNFIFWFVKNPSPCPICFGFNPT